MAITDALGLPIAVGISSASPHEVTLVEETLDNGFLADAIHRLIGDKPTTATSWITDSSRSEASR